MRPVPAAAIKLMAETCREVTIVPGVMRSVSGDGSAEHDADRLEVLLREGRVSEDHVAEQEAGAARGECQSEECCSRSAGPCYRFAW